MVSVPVLGLVFIVFPLELNVESVKEGMRLKVRNNFEAFVTSVLYPKIKPMSPSPDSSLFEVEEGVVVVVSESLLKVLVKESPRLKELVIPY